MNAYRGGSLVSIKNGHWGSVAHTRFLNICVAHRELSFGSEAKDIWSHLSYPFSRTSVLNCAFHTRNRWKALGAMPVASLVWGLAMVQCLICLDLVWMAMAQR